MKSKKMMNEILNIVESGMTVLNNYRSGALFINIYKENALENIKKVDEMPITVLMHDFDFFKTMINSLGEDLIDEEDELSEDRDNKEMYGGLCGKVYESISNYDETFLRNVSNFILEEIRKEKDIEKNKLLIEFNKNIMEIIRLVKQGNDKDSLFICLTFVKIDKEETKRNLKSLEKDLFEFSKYVSNLFKTQLNENMEF